MANFSIFSRYVFIVITWILQDNRRCLHFDWKKHHVLLYLFLGHFCGKAWHSIDDSFAMTCSTIRSNNSQVEFTGQLLKGKRILFLYCEGALSLWIQRSSFWISYTKIISHSTWSTNKPSCFVSLLSGSDTDFQLAPQSHSVKWIVFPKNGLTVLHLLV